MTELDSWGSASCKPLCAPGPGWGFLAYSKGGALVLTDSSHPGFAGPDSSKVDIHIVSSCFVFFLFRDYQFHLSQFSHLQVLP